MSINRSERQALKFLKKRTKRSFFFQIIFTIAFLVALNFYPFAKEMDKFRKCVFEAENNFYMFIEGGQQKFRNFTYFFSDEFNTRIREVSKEMEITRFKLQQLKELEQENSELKTLLKLKNQKTSMATAEVVDIFSNEFNRSLIINIGTEEEVSEGNLVCNSSGLIGRVIEVTKDWSRVLLITDVNSNIPVKIGKANAILAGTNSKFLKISIIHEDIEINEGDVVETSGYGSIFKSGILVGNVVKVHDKFFIEPAVQFSNLKYVIILRKKCT